MRNYNLRGPISPQNPPREVLASSRQLVIPGGLLGGIVELHRGGCNCHATKHTGDLFRRMHLLLH